MELLCRVKRKERFVVKLTCPILRTWVTITIEYFEAASSFIDHIFDISLDRYSLENVESMYRGMPYEEGVWMMTFIKYDR